jgi:hypothetical protein
VEGVWSPLLRLEDGGARMHGNVATRSIVLEMHGVGDGRVLAYSDTLGQPARHAKIQRPLRVVHTVRRRVVTYLDGRCRPVLRVARPAHWCKDGE